MVNGMDDIFISLFADDVQIAKAMKSEQEAIAWLKMVQSANTISFH